MLFTYRAGGPWLVVDMRRGESMLELDPSVAEEVSRGINNDGSNLSGVSARCWWAENGPGLSEQRALVSVFLFYIILFFL
jgi:suppressor of fused-like protein